MNHGVYEEAEGMFAMGEEAIALTLEEKLLFEAGYKAAGVQFTDDKGRRDVTEFVNISKDDALAWPAVAPRTYPSVVNARMESTITPFVKKLLAINNSLIGVLNDKLGLPASALASLHKAEDFGGCMARFLRAPPYWALVVPAQPPRRLAVRLSVAQPLPEHAIRNIGDALNIFSDGILRSNIHRVVPPPRAQAQYKRHTVVFFTRPNDAVELRALSAESERIAAAVANAPPGKYAPGVTAMEWLVRRVKSQRMTNYNLKLSGGRTTEFLAVAAEDALVSHGSAPYAYPAPVNARMGDAVGPFVRRAIEVNGTMLAILNEKLRLPRSTSACKHRKEEWGGSEVRVTRSRPREPFEGTDEAKATLTAHTYFDHLSFFRDCFGGLPARGRGGMASHAIGDALTIFSGGLLRTSNLHRVVPPGEQLAHCEGYSLVYFTPPQTAPPADQSAIIADAVARAAPHPHEIFDLTRVVHAPGKEHARQQPEGNVRRCLERCP
ncbi:uncharacterized protein BXZ73DRAFT_105184 [Epithele typhae]|uniref:uncharacterized protein n=1 Tax=Epithele typhae TaxID=378194 RepID=UPI0020087DB7|nr:uncharacterized protein BXZ73DRAFT_105184 [Epithele typhae]KAH9918549.1 hypothetical protein BXZ73DRAFT_105184 [Epithele typhae]